MTCREVPPQWVACASHGPYSGALRDLVLLFKYRRMDELSGPLADLIAPLPGTLEWPAFSAIVPVPLSLWRRLRRGFNQAELLATRLGRRLGVPVRRSLRRRGRGAQVGRSRAERLRLARRSFALRTPLSGAVLLVDDVVTTGSTAAACTRALMRGGAQSVHVLALARAASAWRPS